MDIRKIKKFYRNKKVFITGHTGFKGIWLFLILKFLGAKVKGYSLPIKKGDNYIFFRKLKNKLNKDTKYQDILNYSALLRSLKTFKPQIVFHLAAQSLVIESQLKPKETLETNVIGTNNIIKACMTIDSVKSLVVATSDKCYLNTKKSKPFKENSKLGGVEVYSSSKAMCEQLINMYMERKKNKIKFALSSVRAGNVIGGGDFAKYRIIPDIIRNFESKSILLRNPNHIRPWQHVLDVCYGYLLIPIFHYIDKDRFNGPYNIGPSNKKYINVLDLTKNFINKIGFKYKINIKKQKFTEAKLLLLNSEKIKKNLKWVPKYDFNKSIILTAEWYKKYLLNRNVEECSNLQINNYFTFR